MAARLRTPAPTAPAKSNQPAIESTDKGLAAGAHLALGDAGSQGAKPNSSARDQPRIDDSTTPGRIEVKTSQDAKQVADRRKASLEARKLDKCPICDQVHTYERTWAKLQPPVKAKLVSTHLTTCSRFLALSPEEKMAAVLGNAGMYPVCGLGPFSAQIPRRKTDPRAEMFCGGKWQCVWWCSWEMVPRRGCRREHPTP